MAYFFLLPKTESLKSSFCIRPLWILNCELFVVNLSVYYRRWKRLRLITVGWNNLRKKDVIGGKHSERVPHLLLWATTFRVDDIRVISVRRSYGCCGYWEVTLSASFRIFHDIRKRLFPKFTYRYKKGCTKHPFFATYETILARRIRWRTSTNWQFPVKSYPLGFSPISLPL